MTGFLKGFVELFLFSCRGIFVLLISVVEGITVDIVLTILERISIPSIYLAGGFSSASNVVVLQLLLLPSLTPAILVFMYSTSFLSGLMFAGYLGKRVLETLPLIRRVID